MPIILWFVEFELEGKLLANQTSMTTTDWVFTAILFVIVILAVGIVTYLCLKSVSGQDVEDDRLYFSEPPGKR